MQPLPAGETRARIFISYKRDSSPDEPLARQAYQLFSEQGCKVFIDQESIIAGDDWPSTIEEGICASDFLLAFTSADSILSEMFQDEIEMGHRFKRQNGKPVIIPIRLSYDEPFPHPLSAYLNRIQWLSWKSDADTPALIRNIQRAIEGKQVKDNGTIATDGARKEVDVLPAPFPSAQIELEDGTMDAHSAFYEKRWEDTLALQLIKQEGKTIIIKGPRQIGKSSLLMRIREAAQESGKEVALIDFQVFDEDVISSFEIFIRQFFEVLTDTLGLENRLEEFLAAPVGGLTSYRCTKYMEKCILKSLEKPLVLAMDEVERLFGTAFQTDFFRMLRTWHNSRAVKPIWKRLDLALVTSTEPHQFIETLDESPFNVGINLEPQDFSSEMVSNLIESHKKVVNSTETHGEVSRLDERLSELMELLGGQPFLVRRALFLVASGLTARRLFDTAATDSGPFGDHLKRHLRRLHGNDDLISGLLQVIKRNRCDDDIFYRLKSAGLVKIAVDEDGKSLVGEDGKNRVVPRCGLYGQFFKQHLFKERLS